MDRTAIFIEFGHTLLPGKSIPVILVYMTCICEATLHFGKSPIGPRALEYLLTTMIWMAPCVEIN